MTEPKNEMPREIWLDDKIGVGVSRAHYTRTDVVEALLKQARDALDECGYVCHDHKIRRTIFDTITAIDTFLEGKE